MCECSAGLCVCVSVCVSVVSVDPVIKCYGPEGWPDIKALNDAIYYVQCLCVCVWGTLLLSLLMFLVVGGGGGGWVSGVLLLGSIAL